MNPATHSTRCPASNSLRPGRPLKRSNYEDYTDLNPVDFDKIENEIFVEFVPKYGTWQLKSPRRIFLRNFTP
ncbi:unnamed protein product [Onchocerca ochengi]|uniref:Hat1_N domain-containing protein n=1 Tax=Onchocerca ochengi TaxID=42157 RepID=A0A182EP13_ONCOC|nr:unnamed protein product [Onchocerca ochengi]